MFKRILDDFVKKYIDDNILYTDLGALDNVNYFKLYLEFSLEQKTYLTTEDFQYNCIVLKYQWFRKIKRGFKHIYP